MSKKPFAIVTETTSDLAAAYVKQNEIFVLPMNFSIGNDDYTAAIESDLPLKEFYKRLSAGETAKTSQINPDVMLSHFKDIAKTGQDILYVAFSSGLSGTYNSAVIAAEEIREEFPSIKILVVDSLCASLGQGLLVDYAVKKRDSGMSIEEAADAVEKIKLNLCLYFTVDDLNHLYRGGRVSKTAAIFGTMLGIKPVLHVNDEGRLIPIGKVRGRKASLDELVNKMQQKLSAYENPYVFISHGDSEEDAKYVAAQIKKTMGIKTEMYNTIGPVIGTHSGPGTIALFFFGSNREERKI